MNCIRQRSNWPKHSCNTVVRQSFPSRIETPFPTTPFRVYSVTYYTELSNAIIIYQDKKISYQDKGHKSFAFYNVQKTYPIFDSKEQTHE